MQRRDLLVVRGLFSVWLTMSDSDTIVVPIGDVSGIRHCEFGLVALVQNVGHLHQLDPQMACFRLEPLEVQAEAQVAQWPSSLRRMTCHTSPTCALWRCEWRFLS